MNGYRDVLGLLRLYQAAQNFDVEARTGDPASSQSRAMRHVPRRAGRGRRSSASLRGRLTPSASEMVSRSHTVRGLNWLQSLGERYRVTAFRLTPPAISRSLRYLAQGRKCGNALATSAISPKLPLDLLELRTGQTTLGPRPLTILPTVGSPEKSMTITVAFVREKLTAEVQHGKNNQTRSSLYISTSGDDTAARSGLSGEWNKYPECELISRHAGECPVWGAHITLLDAITIIEEDFPAFKETMREVIARHLPIAVGHPHLMKWGDNVFLRWKDEEGMSKLKDLRVELADAALPFAVTERVDWEKVNEVERLLDALGDERAPAEAFRDGLDKLKSDMMRKRWFKFIYALNVPLEWYLKARAKKPLADGKMPFSPSPHMSVATAVRADGKREIGVGSGRIHQGPSARTPGVSAPPGPRCDTCFRQCAHSGATAA